MLSALMEPIDQVRGFAFGADAYMTKPFDSAELMRTVVSLIAPETQFGKLSN